MKLLGNIIWLILGGLVISLIWALIGRSDPPWPTWSGWSWEAGGWL